VTGSPKDEEAYYSGLIARGPVEDSRSREEECSTVIPNIYFYFFLSLSLLLSSINI
jgi:hypothetical protein